MPARLVYTIPSAIFCFVSVCIYSKDLDGLHGLHLPASATNVYGDTATCRPRSKMLRAHFDSNDGAGPRHM